MVTFACQHCGASFESRPDRPRKYCSRECTYAGRRVDKGRACEVCDATFQALTDRQRYCSQKCHGAALQGTHYGPSVTLTCEQCGKEWTVAPSHAVNMSNGSPKRFCSRACKGLAKRGKWPLEKTNLIVYTCEECGKEWHDKSSLRARKKFCSRACLGAATIRRLATLSPTSIEVETYQALDGLCIAYEPQYRIGRWVVDAFIPSLGIVIECQGDFHHCNPAVYPAGPRYAVQRKTVARDQERRRFFESLGYRMVWLWERDIRAVGARALLEAL